MELKIEKVGESAPKIEAVPRGNKKNDASASGGAYFVTGPTGGQGATLTAKVLGYGLTQMGVMPKPAAADPVTDLLNANTQSHSGASDPNVEEFGLGPTGSCARDLAHYDRIAELMMHPAKVIDVSTGVFGHVLDWWLTSQVSDLIGPGASNTVVIPLTANLHATRMALSLVQRLRHEENKGGPRFSCIAIVVNDRYGEVLKIAEIAEIVRTMQQQMGVRVATMSRAPHLLAQMENAGKTFEWVLKSTREEIQIEFHMTTRIEAHREHHLLKDWLAETLRSFAEAGFIGANKRP